MRVLPQATRGSLRLSRGETRGIVVVDLRTFNFRFNVVLFTFVSHLCRNGIHCSRDLT